MKHRLAAILAATAAGVTLLATGGATASAAAPDPTQQKINKILAEHPGGTQTGKHTIAWQKGNVVLTLPGKNAKAASTAAPCPDGRFCLYEHAGFGGASVSFRDRLCDNRVLNLPSFNFNDVTSSWANNTDFDVDVWSDIGAGGARLFPMPPFIESPGLSKNINDKASSLNCF